MSQPTITLPSIGASPEATASGLSAGGFMTGNMFTIFSSTFSGAGIVAGNPWACRQLFTKEECKSAD
jgi:poly(3-hydroxybutyrate) depolymerase